jgi:hypothetical protein
LLWVGSKISDEDWSTGQGYYENEFGDIDTDTADIGVLGMPYQVFPRFHLVIANQKSNFDVSEMLHQAFSLFFFCM